MKSIFNEDINRYFIVVYFILIVLAFSAGLDFFAAINLADLVTVQNRWIYPRGSDSFVPI
jgi:hypothetical protein